MPDNQQKTRIKKLSPLLINQLAAGEVVTRPASVVKELLENAIDAGASSIEVRITQGGMGMIEVIDNGTGIHPDDMIMAITRHATSKVADVANLHGITTLGFRGEALAATAAVSRLTLSSSHDDSGIGRQLQVAGVLDDVPKLIPVVHQRGTTITVKDLYFNVPARRGNLKSIATEFSHIETSVREVALARADVALTLFHDNKKRLSLSVGTTSISTTAESLISENDRSPDDAGINDSAVRSGLLSNPLSLSRLEQATGIALTDNALDVAIDLSSLMQPSIESAVEGADRSRSGSYIRNNGLGIRGWLWPVSKQSQQQDNFPKLLYVNGRLVKEPIISNQLRQLAHNAQLQTLGYALYFEVPIQWLNVNVHPSKQRIKISPLNNIMAHLSHAIQSKLKAIAIDETTIQYEEDARAVNKDLGYDREQGKEQSAERQNWINHNQSVKKSYHSPLLQQQNTHQAGQVSEVEKPYKAAASINTVYESQGRLTSDGQLPYCLDVITRADIKKLEAASIDSKGENVLPWLLFYNQGHCLLVSAEDWYSKTNLLFESNVLGSQVFDKNKTPIAAADINQQLKMLSMQMSAQDLMIFITDIELLLNSYAIHKIDRKQLIALMLLPESENLSN
ncbi:DNA mismatch repair endonuclease MutL [Psychrobacter sp.]|uniref:DNA mismatch repair endonuclease MutL n=1 Tax=Psychrobacter sp. TaxID=56811 RepID=UPI00264A2112|nr:DNA mismatch repair endonuclease MutL [Psychrobacter sp.]MDN6308854.1 DNA mismatch repair endonuclease MutL [Psychrobacter sp.]